MRESRAAGAGECERGGFAFSTECHISESDQVSTTQKKREWGEKARTHLKHTNTEERQMGWGRSQELPAFDEGDVVRQPTAEKKRFFLCVRAAHQTETSRWGQTAHT